MELLAAENDDEEPDDGALEGSGDDYHQQNRKVPTLKGRQYKVLQLLGSKAEQYKHNPNLGVSLYSRSRW